MLNDIKKRMIDSQSLWNKYSCCIICNGCCRSGGHWRVVIGAFYYLITSITFVNKTLKYNHNMSLLTTNTKLKKSLSLGYSTFGIHFAPSNLSGKNVCPSASVGCRNACLYHAGYGAYPKVQQARIKKTQLFNADKKTFLVNLIKEVEVAIRRTKKNNLTPCFRLNLTSDIPWETIKIDGKNIFEMYPDVQWYDYTKSLKRMINFLTGKMPKNYHLTFSRSESNDDAVKIVLGMGGQTAMVFSDKLPKKYMGYKVVDGDDNDLRFLDPKKTIIGLKVKGSKGKADTSGFIIKH